MPIALTWSTKSWPKMRSRSRSRYLGAVSHGKASRICCAVHSAVGCAVTAKCTMRRRVRQHQKHVQDLEPDRRHDEEVHRNKCFQVVVEEGPPGWRRRLPVPDHVLADAGLTDVDAQLQKLAVNVRSAPEWIFAAQHADQFAHVFRHRWTAGLAVPNLPTPEQAKALTLPANHCGRLDDESAGFPV